MMINIIELSCYVVFYTDHYHQYRHHYDYDESVS